MTEQMKTKKSKASTLHDTPDKMKPVKKTTKKTTQSSTKKRKAVEDAVSVKVKKTRVPSTHETVAQPNVSTTAIKKGHVDLKNQKPASRNVSSETMLTSQDQSDSSEESEIDDQTETLLQGFSSDEDENDVPVEAEDTSVQSKSPRKKQKDLEHISKHTATLDPSNRPGVVYIGRVPHGFYENEMKGYFKQFGNILKLRLSRNRKTGASKHHAWIQFESAAVAEIVSKTMDNYLMFGHLLKVKLVPDAQVPENLFKGANKRFKKVPWNKMEGRKLQQPLSRDAWLKRIEREKTRRAEKAAKLKNIGYEFESPQIKLPNDVLGRETSPEQAGPGESLPAEAPVQKSDESQNKKIVQEELKAEPPVTVTPKAKSKSRKKSKNQ